MKLLTGFTKITWWILWFMRNEHQPAASGHWSSHWVTGEWSWLVSPPIGVIQESSCSIFIYCKHRLEPCFEQPVSMWDDPPSSKWGYTTLITGMYWEDPKNNTVTTQLLSKNRIESPILARSKYYTYLHFGQDHRQARLEIMGPKNYRKSTDWASIITH